MRWFRLCSTCFTGRPPEPGAGNPMLGGRARQAKIDCHSEERSDEESHPYQSRRHQHYADEIPRLRLGMTEKLEESARASIPFCLPLGLPGQSYQLPRDCTFW